MTFGDVSVTLGDVWGSPNSQFVCLSTNFAHFLSLRSVTQYAHFLTIYKRKLTKNERKLTKNERKSTKSSRVNFKFSRYSGGGRPARNANPIQEQQKPITRRTQYTLLLLSSSVKNSEKFFWQVDLHLFLFTFQHDHNDTKVNSFETKLLPSFLPSFD